MASGPLTIAIDARELLGRPTGVGRYVRELLREWTGPGGRGHSFCLILPEPPPAGAPRGAGITVRIEPGRNGTWWEQARLPRAVRESGADVLFSPAYSTPLRLKRPAVVAIHDVSFAAHPEWFAFRERLRRQWITRASARAAAAVVTISQFSAGEIVRHLGVPPAKIVLAPPGSPPLLHAADARRSPTVLFVGSLFERRRIGLLVEALGLIRAEVPAARLVLIGDNRMRTAYDPLADASARGLSGAVEWRHYVSDADLDAAYREAAVFAFLSDYEGFAMTPAEALARGAMPVLLDTVVAREVYEGAARFVRPTPASVAEAVVDLLRRPDQRAREVAAARDRLRRYSWAESAAVVLDTLEAAAWTART